MRVAVIINPISGTGGDPDLPGERAKLAAAFLGARGLLGDVFVTDGPGHATELARTAVARGAMLVAAWGGDGTVNEVGSALAFTATPLAIIPSGSGNGLARELQIPLRPDEALTIALTGRSRRIDAGEIDGRLFFNIAGIGLDARVAHRFAEHGWVRRGFVRYLQITAQELFKEGQDEHTITIDAEVIRHRMLLIAVANGRQYGNGAVIAPEASLDDGRLDVVIVAARSGLEALTQVPRVFAGRVAGVRGVTMRKATRVEIASARPMAYHVDGEPFLGGTSITVVVHPAALNVRVPPQA